MKYTYLSLLLVFWLLLPRWGTAAAVARPFQQLDAYVQEALDDTAMQDFRAVAERVRNNIFWKQKGGSNKYQRAYERSYPFFQKLQRDDMPAFVFLIPTLESAWHPRKGNPASDYGYWQMVSEVIAEIKTLDQASEALRNTHPDEIRSDPALSTEAALIHIRRYYFYFRHVAQFPEADAWLFSMTAFNWGAGNVKRMLQEIGQKNPDVTLDFATFYHALYEASQQQPDNKSMRVALEYVPNLWNLAQLLEPQSSPPSSALTLNRSSSVSTP